ncbi:MAG: mechanosensitive ion channel domain-containing protein [Myxococcota bacterium]
MNHLSMLESMRSHPEVATPLRALAERVVPLGLVAVLGLLATPSQAQAQAGDDAPPSETTEDEDRSQSRAERIVALRTLLAADRAWRNELKADMRSVRRAFEEASSTFMTLSKQLSRGRLAEGDPAPFTEEELKSLTAERNAARDRFDALIERRTALEKQFVVLDEKIAFEAKVLDNLVAGRPLLSALRPSEPPTAEMPSDPSPSNGREPTASRPGLPSLPGLEGLASARSESPSDIDLEVEDPLLDPSVVAARERLQEAEINLSAAEDAVRLVDYAIALFEEDLESALALRNAAHEVEASLQSELATIREEIESAKAVDPPDPRIAKLISKEEDTLGRLTRNRERVARHDERITSSESVVQSVRQSRDRLVRRVESAREEMAVAERNLAFVKSPLAPHHLVDWLGKSGPQILIIVALMFGFRWLANLIARRVIGRVIGRTRRGDEVARRERAETIGRVFRSSATIIILVVGLLAIFDQAGMDITVLLGGAAVFGAAIAFGSQSLIKDYFSGFMLLAENQYSVGNVIRIGSTSGVVEDINLRITVLRDLEGIVHFIPHSQVSTVSNLTYGWSRALFDIGVAYKEDVNQVMQELVSLGRELRTDENFRSMILDDPEMLGVDAFGDSAVVIKFFIKTRPLMQWNVKREMLRRIKMRFDELGIEIPFPHRTVFHRTTDGAEVTLTAPREAATPS